MTDRALLQQALDALEEISGGYSQNLIAALRDRLAQPEQEPVATVRCINGITIGYLEVMQPVGTKLYTTPPQRQWQGLARLEFQKAVEGLEDLEDCWIAIESALREKNT